MVRLGAEAYREARSDLAALRREVALYVDADGSLPAKSEQVASEDFSLPLRSRGSGNDTEIASLVSDVFVGERWEISQVAMGELLAHRGRFLTRIATIRRGAGRAPLLAVLASALVVLSSRGMGKLTWYWVGSSVFFALCATVSNQVLLGRARRAVKSFHSLCETLQQELDQVRSSGSALAIAGRQS